MGRRVAPLAEEQVKLLHSYDWPGNVRELQNVVERAIILSQGPVMQLERAMCGVSFPQAAPVNGVRPEGPPVAARILTVDELAKLERDNITRALECSGWKVAGAAGRRPVAWGPPTTLTSRMKALGIARPPG